MVDFGRVGSVLLGLLVRGVEAVLALVVLLAVWTLGDLFAEPESLAELVGAGVPMLALWGAGSFLLVALVALHALVGGYRLSSADGTGALRRPVAEAVVAVLLGAVAVVVLGLADFTAGGGLALFAVSAAVAFGVLFVLAADALRAGRSLVAS